MKFSNFQNNQEFFLSSHRTFRMSFYRASFPCIRQFRISPRWNQSAYTSVPEILNQPWVPHHQGACACMRACVCLCAFHFFCWAVCHGMDAANLFSHSLADKCSRGFHPLQFLCVKLLWILHRRAYMSMSSFFSLKIRFMSHKLSMFNFIVSYRWFL